MRALTMTRSYPHDDEDYPPDSAPDRPAHPTDPSARGLAWREGVADTPECMDLVREIRAAFPSL